MPVPTPVELVTTDTTPPAADLGTANASSGRSSLVSARLDLDAIEPTPDVREEGRFEIPFRGRYSAGFTF